MRRLRCTYKQGLVHFPLLVCGDYSDLRLMESLYVKKILQWVSLTITIALFQSCGTVQNMMPLRVPDWEKYSFNKVREYAEFEQYIIENTHHRIIGNITYKNLSYNIYEITIDNGSKKDMLILGGVHGNEPAGVLSNMEFIKQFRQRNFSKQYNYKIVPLVNPWGFEHNVRFNGDGVDINRDFSGHDFASQEARIIINTYKDVNPDIVIDSHEDNSRSESYFFVYSDQVEKKMKVFVNEHPEFNYDSKLTYFMYKSNNGIVKIDPSILGLVKMANRWALSNFFLSKTSNVVVIESGANNVSITNRVEFHLKAMDYISNTF